MKKEAGKKTRQNTLYIGLSIFIIVCGYALFQCILLVRKPTNSMIAKNRQTHSL